MPSSRRSRLTSAHLIAGLALFVALGGSSFAAPARKAASRLITGTSIKNNSVTGSDIKNSSLTTSDVKDRSLLAKDFKASQLPAGARGATGAQGPQGAAGATSVVIRTASTTVPANTAGGFLVEARCDPGQRATGGGADSKSGMAGDRVASSIPITATTNALNPPPSGDTPTGWGIFYAVPTTSHGAYSVSAYAVCANP